MKKYLLTMAALVLGTYAVAQEKSSPYSVLQPTAVGSVKWTGGFWGERFDVFSGTSVRREI